MKLKPILLYILFFMAAFIVFAFLLFPQKEVAATLSRSLTDPDSTIVLTIDNVRPGFPFKLKFENTKLLLGRNTQIILYSFDVFLDIFFIFNEEKHIRIHSDLYQGSVKGSLRLDSTNPFLFSEPEFFMSGVKIRDFRYKTGLADIALNCELSGEYKQIEAADKRDSRQGLIHIRNFSAKMNQSLFNTLNLPVIDFSDIELEFTQQLKAVTLIQCTAKGPSINVKLKGNIDIVFPVQESRLNLTGAILPDSPYLAKFVNMAALKAKVKNISKDGIKFNINGTLKNPKIGI
ncbi:MAG: type II secretion system protein GspN [Desulfobacula sp.]|uniref:type II secretion system protein GspN n=1 Tax=Desulfobacula sp. TaxID=2593537 RepID=UPI0025C51004|nr:type II secretion system protein GspN [Desulfobacula sp.]MCD4718473.1 type II secretion system protein GspN [Desulfobacula sp.]